MFLFIAAMGKSAQIGLHSLFVRMERCICFNSCYCRHISSSEVSHLFELTHIKVLLHMLAYYLHFAASVAMLLDDISKLLLIQHVA